MEDWMTPQEVATMKGIALASVYKAIERGKLPASTVLGRKAIRRSDADAYQPGKYGEKEGRVYKKRGIRQPNKPGGAGEAGTL